MSKKHKKFKKNSKITNVTVEERKEIDIMSLNKAENEHFKEKSYDIYNISEDYKIESTSVTVKYTDDKCMFIGDIRGIKYTLEIMRLREISQNKNLLLVNITNDIDGDLDTEIIEATDINKLRDFLIQKSQIFQFIGWDCIIKKGKIIAIGLYDIIVNIVCTLGNEHISTKLGFVFKNDVPKYFAGTSIIESTAEGSKDCPSPVLCLDSIEFKTKNKPFVLKSKGNVKNTIEFVNKISNDNVLSQTVLSAGLSASIVGMLERMSFMFSIAGNTSSGKTTFQKLASSFYANPLNQFSNRRFSDTSAKLRDSLNDMNGFLITIDDTSADTRKKNGSPAENNLKNLSYFISGNSSRGKMTAVDSKFNTVVMITSEYSVMEEYDMFNDGSNRRIVEIDLSSYGGKLTKNAEEAIEINEHIKENYGMVAIEFARRLFDIGLSELEERFNATRKDIQMHLPKDGLSQGYGETITPIVLSAEIANDIGLHFDANTIKEFLIDDFVTKCRRIKENEENDKKMLYSRLAYIAFTFNREDTVRKRKLCVNTNETNILAEKMSVSTKALTQQMIEYDFLGKPGKDGHYAKKKSDNTRYYELEFNREMLFENDDLFKDNCITENDISTWLNRYTIFSEEV